MAYPLQSSTTVSDLERRAPPPATWSKTRRRFARELAASGLPRGPRASELVRDEDIAGLPETAQRFLRFMGVVGRPRDWSLRAGWTGRFRRGPNQAWVPCEAWQYDTTLPVGRIFHMSLSMGGVVPTVVRDTYVDGHARMLGKVLDLVPVVDATGPDLDAAELVTYLNDAILLAPSMVLGPRASWTAAGADAFDVALTDRGRTVAARVFVDERGAPRDFETEDRFVADPFTKGHPFIRARWTTPVERWTEIDGRQAASRARAIWHLPAGGTFAYADFGLIEGSLARNVEPGQ